jgi:hypothetical protein
VLRQAIFRQLILLSFLSFPRATSRLSSLFYSAPPLSTRRLRTLYRAAVPTRVSVISSWGNLSFSPSPFLSSLARVLESPGQRSDLRQQRGPLNHARPIRSDFGNLKLSPSELDSAERTHKRVDTTLRAYNITIVVTPNHFKQLAQWPYLLRRLLSPDL